jgi:hypothetical protein
VLSYIIVIMHLIFCGIILTRILLQDVVFDLLFLHEILSLLHDNLFFMYALLTKSWTYTCKHSCFTVGCSLEYEICEVE